MKIGASVPPPIGKMTLLEKMNFKKSD